MSLGERRRGDPLVGTLRLLLGRRLLGRSERKDRQAQKGVGVVTEGRVGPHQGRVRKSRRHWLPGKLELRLGLRLRHVGGHCGRGGGGGSWVDAAGRTRGVAETLMLRQRGDRAELGSALGASNLHAAFGVHALVPAEIRELGVRLEADLALEGLDAAVDVGVLLETATGGEGLAALGAGVTSGTDVSSPDVSLELRRVDEHLPNTTLLLANI